MAHTTLVKKSCLCNSQLDLAAIQLMIIINQTKFKINKRRPFLTSTLTNLVTQHTSVEAGPHIWHSFQELRFLHIVPFLYIRQRPDVRIESIPIVKHLGDMKYQSIVEASNTSQAFAHYFTCLVITVAILQETLLNILMPISEHVGHKDVSYELQRLSDDLKKFY